MTATPPNWYPDPSDPARIRWWDGDRWTDHTQPYPVGDAGEIDMPLSDATVPIAALNDQTEALAPLIEEVPVDEHSWLSAGVETPPVPAEPPPLPPASDLADGKQRSLVPWIVGAGAVLLIGGGIALWATSRGDDDTPASGTTTTARATATLPVGSTTIAGTTTTTRPPTTSGGATSTTGPATTTRPATTTSIANGVAISDPAFRMTASARWEETRAAGLAKAWFTGGQSPAYRDNVNVVVERLPADLTVQEYVAASIRNAPGAIPTFVEIGNSVIDVNGKKLGQIDFRQTQGGLTLRHRAIISVKGRNAVTVTYTTQPERFEADVPGIMQFMTTIEAL